MATPQATPQDPMEAAMSSMGSAMAQNAAPSPAKAAPSSDPMAAAFADIGQHIDPKTAPPMMTPGEQFSEDLANKFPSVPEVSANPLMAGAIKGLGETGHTLGAALNRAIGAVSGGVSNAPISWLPQSFEQPKELESANMGESIGKMGESLAEFALGEGAAKAPQAVSVAEKLGEVMKITELAKKSPMLTTLISLGLKAARGAAVGGVTGGLHGGAEGAEMGAALGAGGEVANETVLGKAKSLLFPTEEVQGQMVRDSIRKVLGNKVDADVADELANRVDKPSFLSSMENELKLAKGKIDTELPTLNQQLDDTLSKSTIRTGNAARMVNSAFDQQVADVTSGVGTGKTESINAINEVRKEVLEKLTNDPMRAQEVNGVKRLVGDQIKKFAPPENLTTVDAQKKEAYRQAYFKLRDIVDQMSPESKELNGRITKAIDAQDVLEKKFPQLKTAEQARTSYQGAKSEAAKKLAKRAAIGVAGTAAGTYGVRELMQH